MHQVVSVEEARSASFFEADVVAMEAGPLHEVQCFASENQMALREEAEAVPYVTETALLCHVIFPGQAGGEEPEEARRYAEALVVVLVFAPVERPLAVLLQIFLVVR